MSSFCMSFLLLCCARWWNSRFFSTAQYVTCPSCLVHFVHVQTSFDAPRDKYFPSGLLSPLKFVFLVHTVSNFDNSVSNVHVLSNAWSRLSRATGIYISSNSSSQLEWHANYSFSSKYIIRNMEVIKTRGARRRGGGTDFAECERRSLIVN